MLSRGAPPTLHESMSQSSLLGRIQSALDALPGDLPTPSADPPSRLAWERSDPLPVAPWPADSSGLAGGEDVDTSDWAVPPMPNSMLADRLNEALLARHWGIVTEVRDALARAGQFTRVTPGDASKEEP